jgi:quinol monooxygenase YgiN
MSLIAILGQFDIHPDDVSAAADLMLAMMNETNKEQGCRQYAYSRDLSNPHRFQLSELWEDGDALAAHFRAGHMATYRAGMGKLRVQSRTVKRYEVTSAEDL